MNDWQLVKWSLNLRDKDGLQRECLGIAIVAFIVAALIYFC